MARSVIAVLAAVAAAAIHAAPAAANDSSAELAAGGLRLVPNWDIVLEREELHLSPAEVRVRYEFRNTTSEEIRQLVAFPLPDVDMKELFEIPLDIPRPDSENFVDFTVRVNGYPLEPNVERRATSLGVDMTPLLDSLGIPLSPFAEETRESLADLDEEAQAALRKVGLGYSFEPYDPIQPFWTLHTTFYWEQVFEPDAITYVEHTYRPVVGSGFFSTYIFDEEDPERYVSRYCIDEETQAGIRQRIAESGAEYMVERRLSYILRTARNWQGRIGEIRILIDKTDPSWLVSLCLDGLRKVSPTQFEFVATDYVPERDLEILFLAPAPR